MGSRQKKSSPSAGKLLLRHIKPHELAIAFAGAVVEHIGSLELNFYGPDWITESPELAKTNIYQVVRELAAYARGELLLHGPVSEHLAALAPLYVSLLGVMTACSPEDESPDTALGLVIHAALGREQLSHGHPLRLVRLSAIAGVDCALLEASIARDELVGSRDPEDEAWVVSAKEAGRWLAARTAS